MSQWEGLSLFYYGKIKVMFQSTNQLLSISTNAFGGLLTFSGHQHLVGGGIPKVSARHEKP